MRFVRGGLSNPVDVHPEEPPLVLVRVGARSHEFEALRRDSLWVYSVNVRTHLLVDINHVPLLLLVGVIAGYCFQGCIQSGRRRGEETEVVRVLVVLHRHLELVLFVVKRPQLGVVFRRAQLRGHVLTYEFPRRICEAILYQHIVDGQPGIRRLTPVHDRQDDGSACWHGKLDLPNFEAGPFRSDLKNWRWWLGSENTFSSCVSNGLFFLCLENGRRLGDLSVCVLDRRLRHSHSLGITFGLGDVVDVGIGADELFFCLVQLRSGVNFFLAACVLRHCVQRVPYGHARSGVSVGCSTQVLVCRNAPCPVHRACSVRTVSGALAVRLARVVRILGGACKIGRGLALGNICFVSFQCDLLPVNVDMNRLLRDTVFAS